MLINVSVDPIVRKCSECRIGRVEFYSGIPILPFFSHIFWTDGRTTDEVGSGSPHFFCLKCGYCGALLWVHELERTKDLSRPKYKTYTKLTQQDYFDALKISNLEKEKERFLRIKAWWEGNDQRRMAEIKPDLTENERENLQLLYKMLDPSYYNECIIKAEIMRELGEFGIAEELINRPSVDEFSWLNGEASIKNPYWENLTYAVDNFSSFCDKFFVGPPHRKRRTCCVSSYHRRRHEKFCCYNDNYNDWEYLPDFCIDNQSRASSIFTIKALIKNQYPFVAVSST